MENAHKNLSDWKIMHKTEYSFSRCSNCKLAIGLVLVRAHLGNHCVCSNS